MSFSYQVKKELCTVPLKAPHCMQAELAGMLHMGSMLTLGAGGMQLRIHTEHPDAVSRAVSLFRSLYGFTCDLSVKGGQLKKKDTYVISVSGKERVFRLLSDCALQLEGGIGVDTEKLSSLVSRDCCRTAFLRGAFLGSGSISNPEKIYHLEFVANMQELAYSLWNIMSSYTKHARITSRRDCYVVYVKEIESIIALLTRMGAHSSILELENIRIVKDIRNNVNRQINCESANIDKTVRSALRQVEDIRLVLRVIGRDRLSPPLLEAAELRLTHPEASLSELAALLGGVSRSGINHRLRRLCQMAQELRDSGEAR